MIRLDDHVATANIPPISIITTRDELAEIRKELTEFVGVVSLKPNIDAFSKLDVKPGCLRALSINAPSEIRDEYAAYLNLITDTTDATMLELLSRGTYIPLNLRSKLHILYSIGFTLGHFKTNEIKNTHSLRHCVKGKFDELIDGLPFVPNRYTTDFLVTLQYLMGSKFIEKINTTIEDQGHVILDESDITFNSEVMHTKYLYAPLSNGLYYVQSNPRHNDDVITMFNIYDVMHAPPTPYDFVSPNSGRCYLWDDGNMVLVNDKRSSLSLSYPETLDHIASLPRFCTLVDALKIKGKNYVPPKPQRASVPIKSIMKDMLDENSDTLRESYVSAAEAFRNSKPGVISELDISQTLTSFTSPSLGSNNNTKVEIVRPPRTNLTTQESVQSSSSSCDSFALVDPTFVHRLTEEQWISLDMKLSILSKLPDTIREQCTRELLSKL
jgi:hypothetical protein